MKLQVFIEPNRIPIEGRTGKVSIRIVPLDDDSKKKFEIAPSLYSENVQDVELFDEPQTIDLSDGEIKKDFTLRYPTCNAAAVRVYVLGLEDDDELLDDNDSNNHFKLKAVRRKIPRNTRFVNRPIKVYSWFEIILFFFAGISTLGAIFEGISLWKQFQ